ncbi:MAG: hypothetical protein WD894_06095 [Pirellulales bacterium]
MKRCSLVVQALLLFAVLSTTVLAGNRELKFYVSQDFISNNPTFREADETTLRNRLATYVDDMNYVLAKTTQLQFTYNPESTQFILQSQADDFLYQGNTDPVPQNHHFAAYVYKVVGERSQGGFASRHLENEFAAVYMGWPAIYMPSDRQNSASVPDEPFVMIKTDYVHQINTILHEIGHNHGIGRGEYWQTVELRDFTGTAPDATELNAPSNKPYWGARQQAKFDPMVGYWQAQDIDDYKQQAAFCKLSSHIIDQHILGQIPLSSMYIFYPQVPQNQSVAVKVVQGGQPVNGAVVEMYRMTNGPNGEGVYAPPYETETTGSTGIVYFDWPCHPTAGCSPHTGPNIALMFRVSTKKAWVTTFDLHAYLPGPALTKLFVR